MNLLLIKDVAEKKDISIRYIASVIEMSDANLHRCIRVNQIQAHHLEQIANLLNVPIGYFFDENKEQGHNIGHHVKGNGNRVSGDISLSECQKELEHLRVLLKEKEERIQDKDEMIDLLKQQLNK